MVLSDFLVSYHLQLNFHYPSFAVQTARVIGTGRVGQRQPLPIYAPVANANDAAPTFNNANYAQLVPTAASNAVAAVLQPHPYYQQNNAAPTRQLPAPLLPLHHHNQHHHAAPMQMAMHMPAPTPYFQPPPVVYAPLSPLPLAADLPPATRQFLESRPKLQDRLSRHRQPVTKEVSSTSSDANDKQSQAV